MGNMGYCRFQNTLNDLRDCNNHIEDTGLSEEEEKARTRLIALCREIAEVDNDESGDDNNDEDEDDE
jgi:hypothetical protein